MNAADGLRTLLEATVGGSAAVLWVLLIRKPLRRWFGARVAYALWGMVPIAVLAVLLPAAATAPMPVAMPVFVGHMTEQIARDGVAPTTDWAFWLLALWSCGAVAFAAGFIRQQLAFQTELGPLQRRDDGMHQAQSTRGLPAAIGVWKPRIVVPRDFDQRYDGEERALLQIHERQHIVHGDLQMNAMAALVRCVFWFNPLMHYAARDFRHDQELACDQRVIATHPQARRRYGEAMLKTQLAAQPVPLGCHWGYSHPLKERIAMLKAPVPTTRRWLAGGACVIALTFSCGYFAWAAQPNDAMTAVPGNGIQVQTKLRIDGGTPAAAVVVARLGEPFTIAQSVNGHDWELTGTVTTKTADLLMFAVTISKDGKSTGASPKIAMKSGTSGQIKIGEDKTAVGGGFEGIDLEVTLLDQRSALAGSAVGAMTTDASQSRVTVEADDSDSVERLTAPRYPADALAKKLDGNVLLTLDLDADGRVTAVEVARSEPVGVFDAAAVEAAWKWQFKPQIENGKAVPSRVRVPLQFEHSKHKGAGAKPLA